MRFCIIDLYLIQIISHQNFIGHCTLDGAVVDIAYSSCSKCMLHLYVSCEGDRGYELELRDGSFHMTSKHTPSCQMVGTLTHKTWVYPDQLTCSCSSISKVISVCVPDQLMYVELMKDSSIYLLDSKGKKYKLDIRDDIIDLNAYHILDRTQQSRLLLICRDLSFFYVYTDILRFYRCLSIVCSCMSSPF